MHCNSIVQCICDMTWKAICSLHLITSQGPSQKRGKKCIYLLHLHELLMAKASEPLGDYPVIKDGSLLRNKSSTVTGINNQSQREGDYKKTRFDLCAFRSRAVWGFIVVSSPRARAK